MPQTDSLLTVGEALEDYLNDHAFQLGLRKVWYGADELIPETPAISIASEGKRRTLVETGHMTYNQFRFVFTIYHARFGDTSVTRKECDELAESVEALLHDNIRLDGLVYTSLVESMESGAATRQSVIMRATRLVWVGQSKTRI